MVIKQAAGGELLVKSRGEEVMPALDCLELANSTPTHKESRQSYLKATNTMDYNTQLPICKFRSSETGRSHFPGI